MAVKVAATVVVVVVVKGDMFGEWFIWRGHIGLYSFKICKNDWNTLVVYVSYVIN